MITSLNAARSTERTCSQLKILKSGTSLDIDWQGRMLGENVQCDQKDFESSVWSEEGVRGLEQDGVTLAKAQKSVAA